MVHRVGHHCVCSRRKDKLIGSYKSLGCLGHSGNVDQQVMSDEFWLVPDRSD